CLRVDVAQQPRERQRVLVVSSCRLIVAGERGRIAQPSQREYHALLIVGAPKLVGAGAMRIERSLQVTRDRRRPALDEEPARNSSGVVELAKEPQALVDERWSRGVVALVE